MKFMALYTGVTLKMPFKKWDGWDSTGPTRRTSLVSWVVQQIRWCAVFYHQTLSRVVNIDYTYWECGKRRAEWWAVRWDRVLWWGSVGWGVAWCDVVSATGWEEVRWSSVRWGGWRFGVVGDGEVRWGMMRIGVVGVVWCDVWWCMMRWGEFRLGVV